MTKTLITLGCSLTPYLDGQPTSWAKKLKEHLCPDKHIQFSFNGGGNQQLLDYLDQYMLTNDLKNTTIAYQLTGIARTGGIYSDDILFRNNVTLDPKDMMPVGGSPDGRWQKNDCYFGSKKTTIWTGKYYDLKTNQRRLHDSDILLTRVVSKLCMLSAAGVNVFVFRGWTGALADDIDRWWPGATAKKTIERWTKCKKAFDTYGVDYIDECLVDWCKENNLEFLDDWHPNLYSHSLFSESFIVPKFT